METSQLVIGNTYSYKGNEVIYKGFKPGGLNFYEFEGEYEGQKVPYSLFEHEVKEQITEIKS